MGVAERTVAEAFVAARRAGSVLESYPGRRPTDLATGYAIQDAAIANWNRRIGGWKVGKINPPLDRELGAQRLAGPVFADTIVMADETPIEMPVFGRGFAAAEAEFMLRLAPSPRARLPETNEETVGWVDEVRLGIEIASSPYPGINRDGPCVTVSDHGNNAGLVLGPTVDRAMWGELDSVEVTLEVDGHLQGKATTATMLDGPFGAARFLLANLAQRGMRPEPGWWISSGAITGVHEVAPGANVLARFGALGSVTTKIAK